MSYEDSFYKYSMQDEIRRNTVENELSKMFYTSMIDYVVDRLELLSPPQLYIETSSNTLSTEKSEIVEDHYDVAKILFKSHNVFEGSVYEFIPQGAGQLFLGDGTGVTYKGQFKDGLPEGNGNIKWSDSSWYEGEFHRGLRHGRGIHVSSEDGRRWYSGQWINGKRHGYGQTSCDQSDGALNFYGDWVDGQPHGYGTASWPDGTHYVGSWVEGRPHGYGEIVWPEDDVYEGEWNNGLMNGTGTYKWNSNTQNSQRFVLRLCDTYTGQWSKSKKHGPGIFFSALTGSTIHCHWVDDILDGPCEIILPMGQPLSSFGGLVFQRNVLYEPPRPKKNSRRGFPILPVNRVSRLPAISETNVSVFNIPCKPKISFSIEDEVIKPIEISCPGLIKANYHLKMIDEWSTFNLNSKVLKIVAKFSEDVKFSNFTINLKLELDSAENAFGQYLNQIKNLYQVYGSFLADGLVTNQPLMTRLGLWQMLIDNKLLYSRISLADFDELLYENKDYAFKSAHDPFEPIYIWQFSHVICELAFIVFYDFLRCVRQEDSRPIDGGLMASALHLFFETYVKSDNVPVPYSTVIHGETWIDNRQTITRMYEVYRLMLKTTDAEAQSLPTVLWLIRLYGPKLTNDIDSSQMCPRLDSVLPAVLDVMFDSKDEFCTGITTSGSMMSMFECSVESIVTLLIESCPKIVDRHGAIVAVDTRLTFVEWYRFILLCIRNCHYAHKSDVVIDSYL